MRPPRPRLDSRLARFPAVNGRILNRLIRNIGSVTRVSMTQNAMSSATPPPMRLMTSGLVQPMTWLPYGWMP